MLSVISISQTFDVFALQEKKESKEEPQQIIIRQSGWSWNKLQK